jgi:hypothetical protein
MEIGQSAGINDGSPRLQPAGELGTRPDVELAVDLRQVPLDGLRADEQLGSDLAVGASGGDQLGNLELSRRQPGDGRAAPTRASSAAAFSAHNLAPRPANVLWAATSASRAPHRRQSRVTWRQRRPLIVHQQEIGVRSGWGARSRRQALAGAHPARGERSSGPLLCVPGRHIGNWWRRRLRDSMIPKTAGGTDFRTGWRMVDVPA